MRYEITLYLDRFVNADVITRVNEDGKNEKGVFIPLKENNVYKTRSGFTVYLRAIESTLGANPSSHYLTLSFSKAHREKIKNIERKKTMGYLTPMIGRKLGNYGEVSTTRIDNILNEK